jgi:hypothetical protein
MISQIKMPERVRTYDEAAVLVGNEQTLKGSEVLLHQVKKLHPKCLDQFPGLWPWRKGEGLSRATRTTNPYVPAQVLYPRTADKLVVYMNSGLRSVANCPGHYTLQIAQFTGRSTFNLDEKLKGNAGLKDSPLRTAHDDAERMADKLAKAPELQQLGLPVYTFHDRTSSRVFIGSFNAPSDPNALRVRDELLRLAVPLSDKSKRGRHALDIMIVPAGTLTEVDEIKGQLK